MKIPDYIDKDRMIINLYMHLQYIAGYIDGLGKSNQMLNDVLNEMDTLLFNGEKNQ